MTTVSIPVTDELADQLPADPTERQRVLELGLKQWGVRPALSLTGVAEAPGCWRAPPD